MEIDSNNNLRRHVNFSSHILCLLQVYYCDHELLYNYYIATNGVQNVENAFDTC
jgi:hypothetical protein